MKGETLETPNSSRTSCIAYREKEGEKGTLQITFRGKNGKPNLVYEYYYVPREIWVKLALSDSKGKIIDSYIKGQYQYKKL